MGIAQFTADTARQYGLDDPFDPAASIDVKPVRSRADRAAVR